MAADYGTPWVSSTKGFQGNIMTFFPRRHLFRPERLRLGVAITVVTLAPAAALANTTLHAYTAAGDAQNSIRGFSCKTTQSDPVVANASTSSMGVPIGGLAFCNFAGSLVDDVVTGATSAASRAFNDGQANLTTTAVAAYDHAGAQASATFTGNFSGTAYGTSNRSASVADKFGRVA